MYVRIQMTFPAFRVSPIAHSKSGRFSTYRFYQPLVSENEHALSPKPYPVTAFLFLAQSFRTGAERDLARPLQALSFGTDGVYPWSFASFLLEIHLLHRLFVTCKGRCP